MELLSTCDGVVEVIMREHKSHSVVIMRDIDDAVAVYKHLNAQFSRHISAGER